MDDLVIITVVLSGGKGCWQDVSTAVTGIEMQQKTGLGLGRTVFGQFAAYISTQ